MAVGEEKVEGWCGTKRIFDCLAGIIQLKQPGLNRGSVLTGLSSFSWALELFKFEKQTHPKMHAWTRGVNCSLLCSYECQISSPSQVKSATVKSVSQSNVRGRASSHGWENVGSMQKNKMSPPKGKPNTSAWRLNPTQPITGRVSDLIRRALNDAVCEVTISQWTIITPAQNVWTIYLFFF